MMNIVFLLHANLNGMVKSRQIWKLENVEHGVYIGHMNSYYNYSYLDRVVLEAFESS